MKVTHSVSIIDGYGHFPVVKRNKIIPLFFGFPLNTHIFGIKRSNRGKASIFISMSPLDHCIRDIKMKKLFNGLAIWEKIDSHLETEHPVTCSIMVVDNGVWSFHCKPKVSLT